MKILKSLSKVIDEICAAFSVVLVAGMVLVTVAQILCRVFAGIIPFIHPLSWSEEAARFMLVWSTFIGASCAYRHGSNIAITAVQNVFPKPVQTILHILVHALCIVMFIAIAYYGIQFCGKQVRMAAAIPIKMSTIYMVIPIGMLISAFHAFVMILEELFDKKEA